MATYTNPAGSTLPTAILTELANIYVLVQQIEVQHANEPEWWHQSLYGEKGALATFSCIVWSLHDWRDALADARERDLPDLTQRQQKNLWKQTCERHEVQLREGLMEAEQVNMAQVYRTLGYNRLNEVVKEIHKLDERLAGILHWCSSAGLVY
ncbi:hypothetical protein LTR85_002521 [Meristemomyces frigidus]|nr:hypothetical protein LTR85_002521 [Meristemomyces frigidus]